jgi:hypothetical protein
MKYCYDTTVNPTPVDNISVTTFVPINLYGSFSAFTDSVSIQNQQANYCGSFTYTVSVTPLNGKTPSTFKLDPAGSKSFQVYSGTFA